LAVSLLRDKWDFIEFVVGVYFNNNREFKLRRPKSQLDITVTHTYAGKLEDAYNLATYWQNITSE